MHRHFRRADRHVDVRHATCKPTSLNDSCRRTVVGRPSNTSAWTPHSSLSHGQGHVCDSVWTDARHIPVPTLISLCTCEDKRNAGVDRSGKNFRVFIGALQKPNLPGSQASVSSRVKFVTENKQETETANGLPRSHRDKTFELSADGNEKTTIIRALRIWMHIGAETSLSVCCTLTRCLLRWR